MEKPSKVEVGQRYRSGDAECVITGVTDGGIRMRWISGRYHGTKYESDGAPLGWVGQSDITYLGPAEPVKPPAPAMGVNDLGDPASCLLCGTGKVGADTIRSFFCVECIPSPYWKHNTDEHEKMIDQWKAGARDFPRPASPPSQPRTGTESVWWCNYSWDDPRGWIRCCHREMEMFKGECTNPAQHFGASPPDRAPQPRTGPGIVIENCTAAPPAPFGQGTESAPPPSPSVRAILQSKERARQAKREEDARAVAGFCDEWELLRDA